MNDTEMNILDDIKSATIVFVEENGQTPSGFAFQAGAKWAASIAQAEIDRLQKYARFWEWSHPVEKRAFEIDDAKAEEK